MKNETSSAETKSADAKATEPGFSSTTFDTWGRVAEDQMHRAGEFFAQGSKMQSAALEHGRELMAYNLKLASEWHNWVSEIGRSVTQRIFANK